MAITYFWAVQRPRNGEWTHQTNIGEPPPGPRGIEDSDLGPYDFVRMVADRVRPDGEWRIVVWTDHNIDRPPVATLEAGQP